MPDFNHGTMSSAPGLHENESPSASGMDCSSPLLCDELEGNSDDRGCLSPLLFDELDGNSDDRDRSSPLLFDELDGNSDDRDRSSPLLFDELDGNSDDSLMYPTDDSDVEASVTDGSEHSLTDPRVDVVPFYFYFGHENGPHLPQRVLFCMRDKRFTFAKHPELVAVLDPKITPIEYFHEDGTFRRLNPSKPLNCTYRTRLIIFRPGRQPRNYVANCIGLRELSYELYLCRRQTGTPCTPIKLGIAPSDVSGGLNIAEYWEWSRQYSSYSRTIKSQHHILRVAGYCI
ncbi:hypothetical protein GALMADRAFT_213536 [Galerina marginata CBS 339.88]|uniref:Uncharacterized protein n=1 Tax=Galerina marginata (strain CBS 339.88) TaxID=685588 RepID=A0A067SPX6_GALM3|nr:hypothetical protein GALMADRAFT_213536 [Galerina marginata CBS 339.88]